jgi:HEPN domain-containing protein
MAERDGAHVLLDAALRDLRALRAMGDATAFADEVFGFHAQQAAEKLLKAWLDHLGEEYPLTHSLAVLSERLRILGYDIPEADEVIEYAPYASDYRYGGMPSDEEIDRPLAVARVGILLDRVCDALADRADGTARA